MHKSDTEQPLALVRHALDEIDDRPIDVTARRVARIASMLGETELAVRLGLELKPLGGLPAANAEDTRRMMDDPSRWRDADGPAEAAMNVYLKVREVTWGDQKGKVDAHGLAEIDDWLERIETRGFDDENWLQRKLFFKKIRESVRHTMFAALCSWERQLTYANTNEQIFLRFRSRVDAVLAVGSPELLDQFSAVYRRLSEAGRDPQNAVAEELAQASKARRAMLVTRWMIRLTRTAFMSTSSETRRATLSVVQWKLRLAASMRGSVRSTS